MHSAQSKAALKLFVAAVVALFTHNPGPLAGPASELVTSRAPKPAKRIASKLERRLMHCTEGERQQALTLAHDAIATSRFSDEDAVSVSYRAPLAADMVMRHVDATVGRDELHRVHAALVVTYDVLFEEVRRDGSDLRNMLDLLRKALSDHESHGPEATTKQVRASAHAYVGALLAERRRWDPVPKRRYRGTALTDWCPSLDEAWAHRLAHHLDNLMFALEHSKQSAHEALSQRLVEIRDLALQRGPGAAWESLSRARTQKAIAALPSRSEGWSRPALSRSGVDAKDWLLAQSDDPRFFNLSAVYGSWGSGKSRLVDEVLEAWNEPSSIPCLTVLVEPASDLLAAVTEAISAATGLQLSSHEAMHVVLQHFDRVLLIVEDFVASIDGSDEVLDQFRKLLNRWLDLPVHWLITADDSAVPLILERTGANLWLRHGVLDRKGAVSAAIPGWIDLDDLNQHGLVGGWLLSDAQEDTHGGQVREPDPEHKQLSEAQLGNDYQGRFLNHPLTVLLRRELGRDGPMEELHHSAIAHRYWLLASEKVASGADLSRPLLDSIMRHAAQDSVQGSSTRMSGLPEAVREAQSRRFAGDWTAEVHRAAKLLVRHGLLDALEDSLSPPAEPSLLWGSLLFYAAADAASGAAGTQRANDGQVRTLRLIEPDDLSDEAYYNAVQTLLITQAYDEPAAMAALRFAYLEATLRDHSSTGEFDVWSFGLFEPGFPREVVWQAAAHLKFGHLRKVMNDGMGLPPRAVEAFWVLRLLRLRPPGQQDVMKVLAFISRYFPLVAQAGLNGYCLLVLDRIAAEINWSSKPQRTAFVAAMRDIDRHELAASVAKIVVEQLPLESAEDIAGWLFELGLLLDGTPDPDPLDDLMSETDLRRLPFWLCLTRLTLRRIADTFSAREFVEALDKAGWTQRSPRDRQAFALARREVHAAMGRTASLDEAGFAEVALWLARGNGTPFPEMESRRAALYAIWHSVPTSEADWLSVDPALGLAVRRLRNELRWSPTDKNRLERIRFDQKPDGEQ